MLRSLIFVLLFLLPGLPGSGLVLAQDTERPLAPELNLLSVDGSNGFTNMSWSPGGSPDVAGYVIYIFIEGEGEAVDTIYNPAAISYTHTKPYANNYSIEYVVAAIDSSENVSPLSNSLNTMYLRGELDTCSHQITMLWDSYKNFPLNVLNYDIEVSDNGAPFEHLGTNNSADTSFSFVEFETANSYCFRISANLESGSSSGSNYFCIETNINRPPDWINGDYSKLEQTEIELSFSFDPASEIFLFRLEKSKSVGGPYMIVEEIYSENNNFVLFDNINSDSVSYYRVAALNSCGTALLYSNTISSLTLSTEIIENEVELRWPEYRKYAGTLDEYLVYRLDGEMENLIASKPESDTIFRENLSNFSYLLKEDQICYIVKAREINNPYITASVSVSNISCIDLPAGVQVPNAFTPNNDDLNEYFYPVLSFTPKSYRLLITNKSGVRLFETNKPSEYWDGSTGGKKLQPDVYLWFLELTTPGGRKIVRKGTVSILFN
ncbi:MAG: gliding motility-associated C-terminal domain-containing protein [Bacteroidales bacterium]|nr:gliding motility-associated C-terminal domain-containing protein [Bacteroidales bacterium]